MNAEINEEPKIYNYLPGIDVLRFIIFLFILANHTKFNQYLNGHSFFFTLTGFVISYISISEIKKNNTFFFKRYLARRFLRTLPLFFLIIFLTFLGAKISMIYFDELITTGELWHFLLLIQNFFDLDIFFPLSNLWALAVTEQYYILLGLLFLIFKKNNQFIGLFFIIIGITVNLLSCYVYNYNGYAQSWYFLVNFGAGNMLAVFCTGGSKMFQRLSLLTGTKVLIFIFGGIIILFIGFSQKQGWFYPYKELVLSIGYALIIFNLGFTKNLPGFITDSKRMQYLGKRTFGMYCWHAPVITVLEKLAGHYNISYSPLIMFVTTLILIIPISILSYRYYESYFLRFKKYFNK